MFTGKAIPMSNLPAQRLDGLGIDVVIVIAVEASFSMR